jgi:hypothetical protein
MWWFGGAQTWPDDPGLEGSNQNLGGRSLYPVRWHTGPPVRLNISLGNLIIKFSKPTMFTVRWCIRPCGNS